MTRPRKPLQAGTYEALLGAVIRHARYYRAASIEVVAEACGVGAETVARWERGETQMSAATLVSICDVLVLPPDLVIRPGGAGRVEVFARIQVWDGLRHHPGSPATSP